MKLLLLLLIGYVSIHAMEHVVPANFDHENDISSDEMSDIAMSLYFDQEDPELFKMVYPKVKARLRDVNSLPDVIHRAIKKDLVKIKSHPSHHRHSHMAEHYPDLVIYLNRVVYRSMKEAFMEEREYSNQVELRANRYKVAAIVGAITAGLLTASGTIIAHFVQPDCPTS